MKVKFETFQLAGKSSEIFIERLNLILLGIDDLDLFQCAQKTINLLIRPNRHP